MSWRKQFTYKIILTSMLIKNQNFYRKVEKVFLFMYFFLTSSTLFNNSFIIRNFGAFLARSAKNRAFRYKSSDLPMQILWAFRCNPLRAPSGKPRPCVCEAYTGARPGRFPAILLRKIARFTVYGFLRSKKPYGFTGPRGSLRTGQRA
jgi:hypothetical protein